MRCPGWSVKHVTGKHASHPYSEIRLAKSRKRQESAQAVSSDAVEDQLPSGECSAASSMISRKAKKMHAG